LGSRRAVPAVRAIKSTLKQKYPANNGLARVLVNPAKTGACMRKGHDVVREYAVYMMPERPGTGCESSVLARLI
jgi:hypothetical protein